MSRSSTWSLSSRYPNQNSPMHTTQPTTLPFPSSDHLDNHTHTYIYIYIYIYIYTLLYSSTSDNSMCNISGHEKNTTHRTGTAQKYWKDAQRVFKCDYITTTGSIQIWQWNSHVCARARSHTHTHTHTRMYIQEALTRMKAALANIPSRLGTEFVCANRDTESRHSTA
jgi:hypothetical protein